MQNFIKTIINGVQKWTKKEIKKSTADWSQNDSSAADYVKNRTHWEEETVIVTEREISGFFLMQEPIYTVVNPFKMNPVAGSTYTVVWDGVSYDVKMQDFDGLGYIGNVNYVTMTSGGNIPFAIVFADEIFLVTESHAASHTISISEAVVHKLDHKYLPDDIGVQPDWDEENENSKAYIWNKPDVALQSDLETTNANVNTANSNIATLQSDMTTVKNNITAINGDLINLRNAVNAPKDYIILKDISNGYNYRIEMQDGNLISSLTGTLDDFTYTTRSDGTIVINGWQQTFYGEPSTEMIVPDNVVI